jgi:Flp pilus assembly protein TadB
MLSVALGLVAVGIVLLFIIPWVGVPLGLVGLALLVLFVLGFARRTSRTAEHGPPPAS